MILDDQHVELFMRILEHHSIRVKGFALAQDALDWLADNIVPLIITDLAMAPMDGLTFIEAVRQQERYLKRKKPSIIWVLSGHFMDDIILRVGKRSPNDVERFIEKGMSFQPLVNGIIMRLAQLEK